MRILMTVVVILLLLSCNNGKVTPDISDIKVDLTLHRFEQRFFSIDTNNLQDGLQNLQMEYPDFYPFFIRDILQLQLNPPMLTEEVRQQILKQIISGYRPINDSIQKKYPQLAWLERELELSFRYVKYYYPDYKVPGLVTFLATFDAPGVVLTPHYLGVGLQQFAGKNFSVYYSDEIRQMYPDYISRRFDREFITASAMKAVVDDIYPDSSDGMSLIEQMIEKGKQWYLLSNFMPDTPDSVITGYTSRQMDWVEKNEGNIWTSILTNTPDLYTIDIERVQNYIGEAPFTQNMETSNSSPGNIGQWVGWRIVGKYAGSNADMTLQEVLATPARKIFQEAKYKPK